MKIVTINNGHNATVGLFENGKCLGIYHEEKFTNVKNQSGFPTKALEYIFKQSPSESIDFFIFAFTEQLISSGKNVGAIEHLGNSKLRTIYNFLQLKFGNNFAFTTFRNSVVNRYLVSRGQKQLKKFMAKKFKIPSEKILFSDHHTNHCLTPFYFFDIPRTKADCLLISLDGAGDGMCSRIFKFNHKKNSITEIAYTRYEHSVGLLYREMTTFLGMKPLEHEYKVMGLAAYVTNDKYYKKIYDVLKKVIKVDKKNLSFVAKFNTNIALEFFKQKFVAQRFDNLAAAMQKLTEDLVLEWIAQIIKKNKVRNIALSGGVFMNVKLNQKILELPEVKKAYFQPSCGDDSLVIGAAAKVFKTNSIPLEKIDTMYLGQDYSDTEIENFLEKNKVNKKYIVTKQSNIEKHIARMLAQNKIIPRFSGKAEWGARSLCNRAILGNAVDLKTFYTVNDQVKMRDFWMPFAPTILDTWAPKYIKNWDKIKAKAMDSTKYMILTFDTTELAREHLRAALHQKDYTIRPQVVFEEDNPQLYKLLKYFEEFTGMGGILNTSLNIHGYPLVGTLDQALFTFENSGLEYLNIGNFIIAK